MGHLKQLVALLAFLGIFRASAQEIQDLDDVNAKAKVVLECDKGSIINRIRSYFDGTDRKWSFGCSKGPAGAMSDDCEWSQITKLNEPWDMYCGSDTYFDRDSDLAGNALITGIKSFYDDDAKDRKWKIKCCKSLVQFETQQTRVLNYNNEPDSGDGKFSDNGKYFDFTIPNGYLLTRFYVMSKSNSGNSKNDRKWRIYFKSYKNCVVDDVKIMEDAEPKISETAVVAVGTVIGCSPDVTFGVTLAQDQSVTESRSFTTAKDSTVSWGASVGFSAGVSAKFLFVESKVTFSREYSYDGSYTFGEENSKSVAKTSGSTAAQLVKGYGPNAYLVYATMDKWTFAADNIAADYYGTCSYYNGDSEPVLKKQWGPERRSISLEGKTFANTQFHLISAPLTATQCTQELSDCIQGVEAAGVIANSGLTGNDLENGFKKCLTDKGVALSKIMRSLV